MLPYTYACMLQLKFGLDNLNFEISENKLNMLTTRDDGRKQIQVTISHLRNGVYYVIHVMLFTVDSFFFVWVNVGG